MTSVQTNLQQFFSEHDYIMPDISLLQPADPFLNTAGEELRRRIFMTMGRGGEHLCLRPEFTIPVCLAHLANDKSQGTYAYLGNVFRQRRSGPAEFNQAGIEIIGAEPDAGVDEKILQDVNCISIAKQALEACGLSRSEFILGDHAIFEAVLAALDMPVPWRARLARSFGDGQKIEQDLHLITGNGHGISTDDPILQKALGEMDFEAVSQAIEQKMSVANMPMSGGRTAKDIAQRAITKAALAASSLNRYQLAALADFFAIEVPMAEAKAALVEFSRKHGISIEPAIDLFAQRAAKLCDDFGDLHSLTWRANFGRSLDYYTGIVFEAFIPGQDVPVCGGGRYDQLMEMLGAPQKIPAVGFSIWIDRFEGAQS